MRGVNRVSQLSDVLVLGCVRVQVAKLVGKSARLS